MKLYSEADATQIAKHYRDKASTIVDTKWCYEFHIHLICNSEYEISITYKITLLMKVK